jgi:hypothetical protein
MSETKSEIDALLSLHDHYGSAGWPGSRDGERVSCGWAFTLPGRPGHATAVHNSGMTS